MTLKKLLHTAVPLRVYWIFFFDATPSQEQSRTRRFLNSNTRLLRRTPVETSLDDCPSASGLVFSQMLCRSSRMTRIPIELENTSRHSILLQHLSAFFTCWQWASIASMMLDSDIALALFVASFSNSRQASFSLRETILTKASSQNK